MAVADRDIKEALRFYLGGILDGERDAISMSRFCTFEMDELYRMDKRLMNGALFYIFARIRRRLSSSVPTLVTVDEFREALEHPMAAKAFDDFLFEGRKLNMAVWVVVQELGKVLTSPLKGAVLQQCFTKVCLANPQAVLEASAAYETLGMNQRDRQAIAQAQPKAHYYVTTPETRRMISLELGPVTLSFLAASSDRDREMVDHLAARHGSNWPLDWLQQRGLPDWAARLADLMDSTAKEAAVYA
jgi:type IV secretion system protein VirB4